MSVNFNSTYFQSFVDFAQRRVDANDAKAVTSATVTQPLGGRKILAIDQSKTDSVHKWTRGFDEWKVNDDTRKLFKQSVALLFGGETKIPESVKKAMLLEDYNQGKPLTARRILAVNEAIKPFIEHFNEKLAEAKSAADTAYDKVNENDEDRAPDAPVVTKAQVDGLVETAMKAVGEDRDALDVLARGNVMNGLLIRGDGALRERTLRRLQSGQDGKLFFGQHFSFPFTCSGIRSKKRRCPPGAFKHPRLYHIIERLSTVFSFFSFKRLARNTFFRFSLYISRVK